MCSFLWHVYAHVAEARPNAPMTLGSDGEAQDLRAFLDASAEFGEQFGADFNAAHVPSANLPRKSLPPGCPKDYFFLYKAEAGAVGAAAHSYSSFKRVWKDSFAKLMNFTGFQEHGGCDVCSRIRAEIRTAASAAAKKQKEMS